MCDNNKNDFIGIGKQREHRRATRPRCFIWTGNAPDIYQLRRDSTPLDSLSDYRYNNEDNKENIDPDNSPTAPWQIYNKNK